MDSDYRPGRTLRCDLPVVDIRAVRTVPLEDLVVQGNLHTLEVPVEGNLLVQPVDMELGLLVFAGSFLVEVDRLVDYNRGLQGAGHRGLEAGLLRVEVQRQGEGVQVLPVAVVALGQVVLEEVHDRVAVKDFVDSDLSLPMRPGT